MCHPISSLHLTRNHHTSTSLLVSGTEDGTVSLWETKWVFLSVPEQLRPISSPQATKLIETMDSVS